MHLYLHTPAQAIGFVCMFLVCSYVFWRGAGVERLAAAGVFIDWMVTPLLQNHDAFRHMQIGVFALDSALTLMLLSLALTTDRIWPLWVTAFQILELLMHVAMVIDHGVRPRAYWIGMEIASYLMLLALLIGAWRETPPKVRGKRTVELGQA